MAVASDTATQTSLEPHGEVQSRPSEVYGSGETLFRLGNGGAGATKLLESLCNAYLDQITPTQGARSIEWICNHSRNTQIALLRGYIDIGLTYERGAEQLAQDEGWSRIVGCIFHDHFCLAGPMSDPAGVAESSSLTDALERIATTSSLFHSRADSSATMFKERTLWKETSREPWSQSPYGSSTTTTTASTGTSVDDVDRPETTWYRQSLRSPAEAIVHADSEGAYLLTDRSTLLWQVSLGNVSRTTVFWEPDTPDHVLMNSCYAILPTPTAASTPRTSEHASHLASSASEFVEWLVCDSAQEIIAEYGRDRVGVPLFARASQGYAKTPLAGGQPQARRWLSREALRSKCK